MYQGKKRPRYFEKSGDESQFSRTEYVGGKGESAEQRDQQKRSRIDDDQIEGRLPFELKEYVRSVAEGVWGTSAESAQDLEVYHHLTSKCIEECKGHETSVCCDPDTSRHLETICRASLSTCLQFCSQLLMNKRKSIVRLCTKAVGSRCLESILYEIRNYLAMDQSGDNGTAALCGILAQLGDVILEEFDTLVASMHSTHILRAFGRVCCGLEKPERHKGGGYEKKNKDGVDNARMIKTRLLSNPELNSCLVGITGRVLDWKSMHEYYYQESISCLVQEFIDLEASAKGESDRNGLRQLITSAGSDEYREVILDEWMAKQASRVWESIIKNSPDNDALENLYRTNLAGKLPELAAHPFANFPLQRLLERCDGKALAKDMVDELLPLFGGLWTAKRCGVLVALAGACARNRVRQKEFKKALRSAAGCDTSKDRRVHLLQLVLRLTSYDDAETDQKEGEEAFGLTKENITPQGSALVQHLLHFRKPLPFVDLLLELKDDQLMTLSCHPAGSHVLDSFFSSETVSEEQKALLANRLTERPRLVLLACDKYGSRLVDKLWSRASEKEKGGMAENLTSDKAMTALVRTPFGKILWNKYKLERYKVSPKEWRKFMSGLKEKKRMLEDLLK